MVRFCLSACFILAGALPVFAQQFTIDRIEEDWELHVGEPDSQIDAPQVTTSMVPFAASPDLHLEININHALKPDFCSGGIQIRVMEDDELLGQIHRYADERLDQTGEIVRWTVAVQKIATGYAFGVTSGSSVTWGSFGGENHYLSIPAGLISGDLEAYDYERSVENSGVSYAGNRVQALKLLRVRYFYSNGQSFEYQVNRTLE